MNFISKEDFVNIIEDVKNTNDYQNNLNNFFRLNDVDGYIYQPDCCCAVIKLLHIIFQDADAEEWISYFCFELDFGRKWKPGTINHDGKEITLSTPEDLYDYLVNYN